jgi:hypothetical protein
MSGARLLPGRKRRSPASASHSGAKRIGEDDDVNPMPALYWRLRVSDIKFMFHADTSFVTLHALKTTGNRLNLPED